MERVDGKRYRAILKDSHRMGRVREMVKGLTEGKITRPELAEELDLRAIFFYHDTQLKEVSWCITPDEVFIWGYDGDEVFKGNWNLFRNSVKRIFNL